MSFTLRYTILKKYSIYIVQENLVSDLKNPKMTFNVQKIFKASFTSVCIIVVGLMMSYWFYKYQVEDRDIGVVDVLALSEANLIEMPVPALCFGNPFITKNLKESNEDDTMGEINRKLYLEYLMGNFFLDYLEGFDYQNVTIDLGNYFLYLKEQWHNSSEMQYSALRVEHKEIFSGFFLGKFLKCFLLKVDINANRHINGLAFYYDLEKLFDDWKGLG